MVGTELEEQVAAIWSGALESTQQVRPEDNFFRLGGDSVSATIVLFKVNEQFGIELDPSSLFEAAALTDFCDRIRQAGCATGAANGEPHAR
jgi:pyochelin synthetase